MFVIGGTELYIHKYLGPKSPTEEEATADRPIYEELKESNIQDLLFLENRDRVYDSSIYSVRGVYNVQDIDFNLSQFGLFIDNDTLYITVHINSFINTVGRKPLSGDVIEVPHLKDEFALNDFDVALPRYFVISDVGRASEGFSPTWFPHLYRLKLTKIVDNQQYSDIFNQPIEDPLTGESTGKTLADVLSTQAKALEINDIIISQAEDDAPLSGYETQHFYTLTVDLNGNTALETIDAVDVDIANDTAGLTASGAFSAPKRPGYTGYLLGDGIPENGAYFGSGITFPNGPIEGDYFLRTDFLPNRLFKYDGTRWVKREDAVRTSMTPSSTRNTLKGTFINNANRTGINLLSSNVTTLETLEISTNVNYVSTMYAIAAMENSAFMSVPVANNNGVAVITLDNTFKVGEKVDWKIYESSESERQPLSKALKMRKPDTDI